MSAKTGQPLGILRLASYAIGALIVLSSGVAFVVRAPKTGLPPTGVITQRMETGSGVTTGYCKGDIGSCSYSGAIISAGGFISGSTLIPIGISQATSDILYQAKTPYSAAVVGSGSVIKESSIVLSNPSTLAVTGTTILSFKIRSFSGNLIGVKASSTTAGSGVTIDVNLGGDTALSTKLTIDEDETDSDTAAAAAAISATADNKSESETVVIDIDSCGNTANGATCPKGLTLNLLWQVTSFAY